MTGIIETGGANLLIFWLNQGSKKLDVVRARIKTLRGYAAHPPYQRSMKSVIESLENFEKIEYHSCTAQTLQVITETTCQYVLEVLRDLLGKYTAPKNNLFNFISVSVITIRMALEVITNIGYHAKTDVYYCKKYQDSFRDVLSTLVAASVD